jgi:hypothetical protein
MPLPAMKFISKQAKVFYLVFEGAKQNLLPAGTHGVEQYRLLLDGIVKCYAFLLPHPEAANT